ncbi:hypothetical protein JKP88DRAFT_350788 [Tribonema minus]|uniref:Uncharacterized protein n=1 Tax=Tribonema minus TaxID=303371 RepID=A0A835YL63_9STRA|nr:hypothetical protein JKP88DRAFT_350788 [Tribonema minus]
MRNYKKETELRSSKAKLRDELEGKRDVEETPERRKEALKEGMATLDKEEALEAQRLSDALPRLLKDPEDDDRGDGLGHHEKILVELCELGVFCAVVTDDFDEAKAATTDGHTAEVREKETIDHHDGALSSSWVFIPFMQESYGRLGTRACRFVEDLAMPQRCAQGATAYWIQALNKDRSSSDYPTQEVYTRITTAACTVENTKDAVWMFDAEADAPFIFPVLAARYNPLPAWIAIAHQGLPSMDSPLNDVGAVSSGLRDSAFLIGDTIDAAVVPEHNPFGDADVYLENKGKCPAPASTGSWVDEFNVVSPFPYVVTTTDVFVPWPTVTNTLQASVRLLSGVAACPKLMAAMQREEQAQQQLLMIAAAEAAEAAKAHQQLLMIEAAEAVVNQPEAPAGAVLSIEDVSHEMGFTQAQLAAGLQNIALQRTEEEVDEQQRKLEACQAEHLRLVEEIKKLEPEVQRKRGIMAAFKGELAGNAAAYSEIQAQLKRSRRTLWRACRAHDFTYVYDYDTETAILTPVEEGEDAYTRKERIRAGDMSYDGDAVVERQQAAQDAADAEFEARRFEAENAGESAEEAEQNGDY